MKVKLFLAVCGLALSGLLHAADEDLVLDDPAKPVPAATTPTKKGTAAAAAPAPAPAPAAADNFSNGHTVFRFAPIDNPADKLDSRLYWRNFQDYCGVETAPPRALIDNQPVFAPVQTVMSYGTKTQYPVEGRRDLPEGDHVIIPGNITIAMHAGKLSSTHPAIKIEGDDVRILCAPIRLEAQDESGRPASVQIKVSCGNEPLLREAAKFNPLILWLPVGLKYDSTLGAFSIGPDGKLSADPSTLAKNVKVTPTGLCLSVAAGKPAPPRKASARVFPHSMPKI